MKSLVEMVCTGNQGRSPVAELIAQNYLESTGRLTQAISSGTMVDAIKKGDVPRAFKLQIISIARNRGDIYSVNEQEAIDQAIGEGNDVTITNLYRKAERVFVAEERHDRQEVLPRYDIRGELKETQDQTIARPDVRAVFSMAGKNNEQVRKIYEGSGFTPTIDVLSAYATYNPTAEIPNAFGLGRAAYERAVETLLDHVPRALDRLLGQI